MGDFTKTLQNFATQKLCSREMLCNFALKICIALPGSSPNDFYAFFFSKLKNLSSTFKLEVTN
jgi:hypothetical protein